MKEENPLCFSIEKKYTKEGQKFQIYQGYIGLVGQILVKTFDSFVEAETWIIDRVKE
jgi:hypothetical protein